MDWVATNCEEFREMKMVKNAKYFDTTIGSEGHIHRWTPPRKKSFTQSLVEGLGVVKIYAISVPEFIESISAPDEATFKEEAHALQCTAAGPCNAITTIL